MVDKLVVDTKVEVVEDVAKDVGADTADAIDGKILHIKIVDWMAISFATAGIQGEVKKVSLTMIEEHKHKTASIVFPLVTMSLANVLEMGQLNTSVTNVQDGELTTVPTTLQLAYHRQQ